MKSDGIYGEVGQRRWNDDSMEMDWDVMHAGLDCKHESSGTRFVISSFRKVTCRCVRR